MSVTFVIVSVVLLCFRPIFPFSFFQPFLFIGGFDSSALCRSRRELSNEYLLAKIGVDTAENEPLEIWGKIQFTIHFTPYWLQPAWTSTTTRGGSCMLGRHPCGSRAKQRVQLFSSSRTLDEATTTAHAGGGTQYRGSRR